MFTFSFCNLTATVAVMINGLEVPRDLRDIAIANYAILCGILLALLSTYLWFHTSVVKRQAHDVTDPRSSEAMSIK